MNRTTTLATVAGFILGATVVLAVQAAVRRHRTRTDRNSATVAEFPIPPEQVEEMSTIRADRPVKPDAGQALPVVAAADVPPARNGDRPPTPNLDRILAQRALEQRDDPD